VHYFEHEKLHRRSASGCVHQANLVLQADEPVAISFCGFFTHWKRRSSTANSVFSWRKSLAASRTQPERQNVVTRMALLRVKSRAMLHKEETMANFLKFWAIVWTIGIFTGFFGSGFFSGSTEACYLGKDGLVDRFSQGFRTQVAQNPQGLVAAQGATDITAAKSRAELTTVAILFGVVTGYFVGSSIHYALYAPACTK
jgi:hypothetical protein